MVNSPELCGKPSKRNASISNLCDKITPGHQLTERNLWMSVDSIINKWCRTVTGHHDAELLEAVQVAFQGGDLIALEQVCVDVWSSHYTPEK